MARNHRELQGNHISNQPYISTVRCLQTPPTLGKRTLSILQADADVDCRLRKGMTYRTRGQREHITVGYDCSLYKRFVYAFACRCRPVSEGVLEGIEPCSTQSWEDCPHKDEERGGHAMHHSRTFCALEEESLCSLPSRQHARTWLY